MKMPQGNVSIKVRQLCASFTKEGIACVPAQLKFVKRLPDRHYAEKYK